MLEKAQVAPDMPAEELHIIATAAFVEPIITFADSELAPIERRKAPLNVTISINNHLISEVLIDTGASLNICSLNTIRALGVNEASLTPIDMTIARYDDSKGKAHGKWTTKIGIGPAQVLTQLIVIDVIVPYQIIFGRQWLDSLKGVSSPRHQCLKFPHNGKIIKIAVDIPSQEVEANVIYLPHQFSVREKLTQAEKGKNIVSMVEVRDKWARPRLFPKKKEPSKNKGPSMNVGWEIMRRIGHNKG